MNLGAFIGWTCILLTLFSGFVAGAETIKCQTSVQALNPKNPLEVLGTFQAGTELQRIGDIRPDGLVPVVFKQPDGKELLALCKADDLGLKNAAATSAKKTDTSRWITDYQKALAIAKSDGKFVLMNFTGSDWCGWCIRLKDEVFDKKDFKDFAREKLVLLELDFPQDKTMPTSVKQQNRKLADEYGIRGYPTIIILSPDGKQVGKTGYREGGPKSYINHLQEMMKNS